MTYGCDRQHDQSRAREEVSQLGRPTVTPRYPALHCVTHVSVAPPTAGWSHNASGCQLVFHRDLVAGSGQFLSTKQPIQLRVLLDNSAVLLHLCHVLHRSLVPR